MPRYFFHTEDHGTDIDRQGVELADDAAARIEAIRYGGAILTDQPGMLDDGLQFRVLVTNEDEKLLFTILMQAIDAK